MRVPFLEMANFSRLPVVSKISSAALYSLYLIGVKAIGGGREVLRFEGIRGGRVEIVACGGVGGGGLLIRKSMSIADGGIGLTYGTVGGVGCLGGITGAGAGFVTAGDVGGRFGICEVGDG